MASFPQALKNRAYLHSSVTFLLFFASWGIWWSFFSPWLLKSPEEGGLGLSGAEQGTVYSTNSIAALIVMFLYGTVQDKLGLKRHLAILASVAMAGVGPFFIVVYEPLLQSRFAVGVVVGAIYLSFGFLAAAGLLEAVSERASRRFGFEYGQARMWGSFGYAIVALVAGFLFAVDPHLNFWVGSAFGVACLLVQILWKDEQADVVHVEPTTPSLREMAALLTMGRLWKVILVVLFTWTFYTVYDQQMFPDFYTHLFDDVKRGEQVYGVLNSVQVFLEAAMMGVVPVLMRKVGVRNILLLGFTVMAVRILGTAVFSDPVAVSVVKMLHALEVPLCILGVFRYFTLHFNAKLSATLYMVGFQIASQVGVVLLSPPLGALRDRLGYQPTFFIIAATVAVAGTVGYLILKKDDEEVDGDPYLRDGQEPLDTAKAGA
ncbi:MFS transporter [Tsukamurella paurometabola]|uniref:Lactose-proton symport n=1 Tax=Tsukamurella paurometabola TaxID=2061 RepID=A0A3P8MEA2_TSUPA|nr:MFS transporter [Tsukamurella paurometabola]MBS4103972.1 MFS transporter [Tsukamurella paurometabola]UEA84215.1 MFS transporter [Tsukamurella paurometabola]VDR41386.1 Lactose-proton symport [Tsukamurella paurometabola]